MTSPRCEADRSQFLHAADANCLQATIDYMICAYGPYSASATGGNGWSRDFLAGVLTLPAIPFFSNIGAASGYNLEYASTILACIATILVVAVYVIYWKGPVLRKRSPFAQQLAGQREANGGRRGSHVDRSWSEFDAQQVDDQADSTAGTSSATQRPGMQDRRYSQQNRFFGESRVTPRGTPRGTPSASRANSISMAKHR